MDDPNRGAERMGMGKRKRSKQDSLFIPTASLARSSSHDFYERLNQVLSADGFDDFVEDLCEPFCVQSVRAFLCTRGGPPEYPTRDLLPHVAGRLL